MTPAITKIQNLLKQSGGYRCPHFKVSPTEGTSKRGCCGSDRGTQYAPVCGLVNGICMGLAQCPRIDVATKSKLIQQWTDDLRRQRNINPLEYVKR